ncbi:MAG TPA: amidohydrolase family protein, partial [Enhygromyxa sp.]|nr:amidohydrolase family protein [Enhygromyxa sp.]
EAENREGLWAALREGVIDLVVTDHSPCSPELKGDGDFIEAWGGIASLSLGLSSVWTHARARGVELAELVQWMAAAPAKLTGLTHKGALRSGCDADLFAFDPDAEFVVEPSHLHFRHKVSPWIGRSLRGQVRRTWLRGQPIYNANHPGGALTDERSAFIHPRLRLGLEGIGHHTNFAGPHGRPLLRRP